jgi:hypothetical protein
MFLRRFLFRTRLSEQLIALLERHTELAIVQTAQFRSKSEVTS